MSPLRPVDFLILLSLVEGERHGYGMLRDIEALSDGDVRLDAGNLYRSLKRLLESDLIERAARRASNAGEDERRQYYRLTARGRKAAAREVQRMGSLLSLSATQKLLAEVES